jgi:enoyl-CoA hydratase/carnithine racemase
LLIAGETAFLQVGEVQIGMAAPRNVAWLMLRHSEAVAARLCLIGDRVQGPELFRLGLATEVTADDQVVARACVLAARIATYPADGVAKIKTSIRAGSAMRAPRDWFTDVAAADPLALSAAVAPRRVQ